MADLGSNSMDRSESDDLAQCTKVANMNCSNQSNTGNGNGNGNVNNNNNVTKGTRRRHVRVRRRMVDSCTQTDSPTRYQSIATQCDDLEDNIDNFSDLDHNSCASKLPSSTVKQQNHHPQCNGLMGLTQSVPATKELAKPSTTNQGTLEQSTVKGGSKPVSEVAVVKQPVEVISKQPSQDEVAKVKFVQVAESKPHTSGGPSSLQASQQPSDNLSTKVALKTLPESKGQGQAEVALPESLNPNEGAIKIPNAKPLPQQTVPNTNQVKRENEAAKVVQPSQPCEEASKRKPELRKEPNVDIPTSSATAKSDSIETIPKLPQNKLSESAVQSSSKTATASEKPSEAKQAHSAVRKISVDGQQPNVATQAPVAGSQQVKVASGNSTVNQSCNELAKNLVDAKQIQVGTKATEENKNKQIFQVTNTVSERPPTNEIAKSTTSEKPPTKEVAKTTIPEKPPTNEVPKNAAHEKPPTKEVAKTAIPERPPTNEVPKNVAQEKPPIKEVGKNTTAERAPTNELAKNTVPEKPPTKDVPMNTAAEKPQIKEIPNNIAPEKPPSKEVQMNTASEKPPNSEVAKNTMDAKLFNQADANVPTKKEVPKISMENKTGDVPERALQGSTAENLQVKSAGGKPISDEKAEVTPSNTVSKSAAISKPQEEEKKITSQQVKEVTKGGTENKPQPNEIKNAAVDSKPNSEITKTEVKDCKPAANVVPNAPKSSVAVENKALAEAPKQVVNSNAGIEPQKNLGQNAANAEVQKLPMERKPANEVPQATAEKIAANEIPQKVIEAKVPTTETRENVVSKHSTDEAKQNAALPKPPDTEAHRNEREKKPPCEFFTEGNATTEAGKGISNHKPSSDLQKIVGHSKPTGDLIDKKLGISEVANHNLPAGVCQQNKAVNEVAQGGSSDQKVPKEVEQKLPEKKPVISETGQCLPAEKKQSISEAANNSAAEKTIKEVAQNLSDQKLPNEIFQSTKKKKVPTATLR